MAFFDQQDFEQRFEPVAAKFAKKAFRGRYNRHELVCETVSMCWELLQTAPPAATPRSMAQYAVRRVKSGRQFQQSARSITGPNPLRKAKAQRTAFRIEMLGRLGDNPKSLAALRIDFPAWVDTLTVRQAQVLSMALQGESTNEIAERLKVSAGAVSQIRAKLIKRYHAYHA